MTPAILDHLWQSTVVALGVALLVMAFRKASAAVRYGLWFAASAKFLVPFTALAALGRVLAPEIHVPVVAAPEAHFIAQAAQPFSQAVFSHAALSQVALSQSFAAAQVHAAPHLDLVPILLAIWVVGCAVVLTAWMIRSVQVREAVRSATPLPWPGPMPVLASSLLWEPGLVGLWRPVLLVPETLSDHLAQPQLDAIMAHEACHLRRRDNVTAAIHMVVEALFWFHPLVWWIGARLIEERERACDEAVVRSGHDRAAYARSLVECCRLYLQSPLSCVAGASGSNLKTRVAAIMTAPLLSPLSLARKALLIAAGVCAFATPVAAGLLSSPVGRQVAAHAVAMASSLAARSTGQAFAAPSAPEQSAPARAVTLARNEAVLAPDPAVAASDAPPLPLAQDVPMRLAALTPPSSPSAQAIPETPVAEAAGPPEAAQALSFVRSYPAYTPQRHLIARWGDPICIQVVGLTPETSTYVRARVEAVARAVGVDVQRADCKRSDVEIGFSAEPQRMLDNIVAHRSQLLGDSTSDTQAVKTITLPIQAWYLTNGVEFAANSTDNLKVLAVYQDPSYFTTGPGGTGGPAPAWGGSGATPGAAVSRVRRFVNVMVIVDLRRTEDKSLGLISDYVAMLALSQPRSLERCNVLPSVTDLFAGACPGRGAPHGLTPTDDAYLAALYAADPVGKVFESQQTEIADRMAKMQIGVSQRAILSNPRVVGSLDPGRVRTQQPSF